MNKTIFHFRRQLFLAIILLTVTLIVSCVGHETWMANMMPPTSHALTNTTAIANSIDETKQPIKETKKPQNITPTQTPIKTPTAEPPILGLDYDPSIDIYAGPVPLPLKIVIPILEVDAPILGVGRNLDNNMDAPKGPYGDPNWSSAFWYRGSAIPGDVGTATIAGHVNGPVGEPETFARIRRLKPGDLIIIEVMNTNSALYFIVDEVKKYSVTETNEPEIMDRIFGGSAGSHGQQLTDGKSHLTLITCTGAYTDGEFDHRIVVFTTLR